MRLDKLLADSHEGSRSKVKENIRKGVVTVNGVVCTDPSRKVGTQDEVFLNGRRVRYSQHYYYMLNKPAGFVSATEDGNERTVVELFPEELRKGLFPVGRLDKDSTGLLIICDDGELAHRLLAPSSHVDKKYVIRTNEPLVEKDADMFREGIILEDGTKLKSADLDISKEDPHEAIVIIREGKYHQVKRMVASCGKKVISLKRISMGTLVLDPGLSEGQYRELTEEEILKLKIAGGIRDA